MDEDGSRKKRIVKATHGAREDISDPEFELGLSDYLKGEFPYDALIDLYGKYKSGEGKLDAVMRLVLSMWKPLKSGTMFL